MHIILYVVFYVTNDTCRRVEFTAQDRDYMIKYLAKYTSDPQGRSGNEIWKALVENVCVYTRSRFP